ncbi:MAG: NAD+ synthase [Desulfobacterium sp.]|nr:NAD+ synthase [Desulfobacterium sp.]MBU3949698.1 NAD+ synthase [Pseudomonadota bacterium]MBU4010824.1 NAD+ synthase [Pseudomonadota bacterium]MBU4036790.1 NAD+ synthase [Pseudomonadota bacterium]
MKIAIAQINPVIGDFEFNFSLIKSFADKAIRQDCDLVVFPELSITGYPPRDLLEKKDFIETNLSYLLRLVDEIRGIGVICGFVDKNTGYEGNPLYNSAVLFENGKILHKTNKRLLPTYDVFDESRYFEAGAQCAPYSYKDKKIGIAICEDAWNDNNSTDKKNYHLNPVGLMIKDGANLIINISASPFHMGKQQFRQNMFGAIARKYKVPFVFVNQIGGNDSVLFDGTSAVFDINGEIAALARDFEEDLIFYDTDRQSGSILKENMHPVSECSNEAVLKALIMGTRDYVNKCGFSKVVLGLSGGIDSALTAFIAAHAIGPENVFTVFMPSVYTSKENYEDTRKLAENIGTKFEIIPIDGVFAQFLKIVSPSFKENEPEVTEQNIQARIRGTILMALSNRENRILLSTGNKSELAVGYCTLYGDMNGGLAVISDIPKTIVYEIAHFINRNKEIIPANIIKKAPSAELKPDQTDQDDLPPYDLLDSILKGYIEELKGAKELIAQGFDAKTVKDIILRVDRNEYKRHQAAPGLKVTSKAFGYGRRYPLAQRYAQRDI